MNSRWVLIRRLRGPAFLLTFAVTALLNQWDVLSFGQSWPLYLIVAGVLTLLERAAIANGPAVPYGDPYAGQYPGQYPGGTPYGVPSPSQTPYQGASYQPAPGQTGTAVVPVAPAGLANNDPHGRQ